MTFQDSSVSRDNKTRLVTLTFFVHLRSTFSFDHFVNKVFDLTLIMENLSPRGKRAQERARRQQQEQMEQRMEQQSQSESPRQTIFVNESSSQSQQLDNNNSNEDNGIIIRELSSRTDSLLQTESQSISQQLQQQSNNNNNQQQLDNIEENININININNNNQQPHEYVLNYFGYCNDNEKNSLSLLFNDINNKVVNMNKNTILVGMDFEILNYKSFNTKKSSKSWTTIFYKYKW